MKKAAFRTKSIGTKVTEEEFARFEELARAAGQTRAEWVRARLLAPAAAGGGTEQVLAEVLALRSILLAALTIPALLGYQYREKTDAHAPRSRQISDPHPQHRAVTSVSAADPSHALSRQGHRVHRSHARRYRDGEPPGA